MTRLDVLFTSYCALIMGFVIIDPKSYIRSRKVIESPLWATSKAN